MPHLAGRRALVEQVLARATTPALKIRALRQLVLQYPDSFDLKLRLLSELEAASGKPSQLANSARNSVPAVVTSSLTCLRLDPQ